MKLTEQIRKYIECPQFGDNHYGKWGALRYDQRLLIKKLCDQCDVYEDAADKFAKENEKLKREINSLTKKTCESCVYFYKDYNHFCRCEKGRCMAREIGQSFEICEDYKEK